MWALAVFGIIGALFGLLALEFYRTQRRRRGWLRSLESSVGQPFMRDSISGEPDGTTGGGE